MNGNGKEGTYMTRIMILRFSEWLFAERCQNGYSSTLSLSEALFVAADDATVPGAVAADVVVAAAGTVAFVSLSQQDDEAVVSSSSL